MNKNLVFKKISNIISNVIFFALIVMLLIVVTVKASNGQASIFGHQVKAVLSGSMEPTFQTGSIITIEEARKDQVYEVGDVITFSTDDSIFITHRIIDYADDEQQYITKGDANDAQDLTPVHADQIVGTYTGFTIPYIGYLLLFMQSKEGAALLLTLPGICLLIYSMFSIRQALRKLEQQTT